MGQDYQVLKIDQLTRVNDRNILENYYRIQIKTRGGTVLSINVDESQFNKDKAAAILKDRANQADSILSL